MTIDPRLSFAFNILLMIVSGVATGAVHFAGLVPDPVAAQIVGWAGIVTFVLSTVNTALHGYSAANAGPLTGPVLPIAGKMILVLLGGLFVSEFVFSASSRAHAEVRIRIRTLTGSEKLAAIDKIIKKLQTIALEDVQTSLALAKAGNDTNGAACYQAFASLISNMKTAEAAPRPKVHLITDFEKMHLIVIALRSGSPLRTACAPLAEETKQDFLTFVASIAAGTVTASSFGF